MLPCPNVLPLAVLNLIFVISLILLLPNISNNIIIREFHFCPILVSVIAAKKWLPKFFCEKRKHRVSKIMSPCEFDERESGEETTKKISFVKEKNLFTKHVLSEARLKKPHLGWRKNMVEPSFQKPKSSSLKFWCHHTLPFERWSSQGRSPTTTTLECFAF